MLYILIAAFIWSNGISSTKADSGRLNETTNSINFVIDKKNGSLRCLNITNPIKVREGVVGVKVAAPNRILQASCNIVSPFSKIQILNTTDLTFYKSEYGYNAESAINLTKTMKGDWECEFLLKTSQQNISIQCSTIVKVKAVHQKENDYSLWIYIGSGVAIIVFIIIVTQAICILYFKAKANSVRRLELSVRRNSGIQRDDPIRYSTCPGQRKRKQKAESGLYETVGDVSTRPPLPLPIDEDERIYEDENTLQRIFAPMPPSLASLPRNRNRPPKPKIVDNQPQPSHVVNQQPLRPKPTTAKIPPPVTAKPKKAVSGTSEERVCIQDNIAATSQSTPMHSLQRGAPMINELNHIFKNMGGDKKSCSQPSPSQSPPLLHPKPAINPPTSGHRPINPTAATPHHLPMANPPPSMATLPQHLPMAKPLSRLHGMASPPVVKAPATIKPPIHNMPLGNTQFGNGKAPVHRVKPLPPMSVPLTKKPPLPTPIDLEIYTEHADSDDEWTYEELPEISLYNV